MENDVDVLIAKRFGLFSKNIFLHEGSKAADLATGIKMILTLYADDQLGGNMTQRLSDSQKRLETQFEACREDYFDDPDNKGRVRQFRKHLSRSFVLATELKDIIEEIKGTTTELTVEANKWINVMLKTIQDILNRYNILQSEFPEK